MLLWKSICSNQLLGKTNLILFLNKVDIFRAKLKAGIQFGQYIISYGNRPNDYDNTSACKSSRLYCGPRRVVSRFLWGCMATAMLSGSRGG